MSLEQEFARWFEQATGNELYPFQTRFACEPTFSELVAVSATAKTTDNCLNPTAHQKENTNA